MPITVYPQPAKVGTVRLATYSGTAFNILSLVSDENRHRDILRSSYPKRVDSTVPKNPAASADRIVAYKNGFVHTIISAWEQDLHLTLRPDDVWLAILTQFSFFVNGPGRAEKLRSFFVKHKRGKKDVIFDLRPDSIETADIAKLALGLTGLVKERMVDGGEMVGEWLMPGFSTTGEDDRVVAAMVFLGAMREYFGYHVIVGCGFPSVTLEGERGDWEDLLGRVGRLAQFGEEAAEWARCLEKAVEGMVGSFDRPEDEEIKEFWMNACHSAGKHSSGETVTLSGWLTSFCWWTAEGKKQRVYRKEELDGMWHLRGPDCWKGLEIDGVVFPVIDRAEIPAAVATVSVTWHDFDGAPIFATRLLAGLTGMKVTDDTGSRVQPASGWWILKGDPSDIKPLKSSQGQRATDDDPDSEEDDRGRPRMGANGPDRWERFRPPREVREAHRLRTLEEMSDPNFAAREAAALKRMIKMANEIKAENARRDARRDRED